MRRKLIVGLIAIFTFLAGFYGVPSFLDSAETESNSIAVGCQGPEPHPKCPPTHNGNSWGG